MSHEYEGDIALLEEISEQDIAGFAYGPTFHITSLGNDGWVCTLTKECQRVCN